MTGAFKWIFVARNSTKNGLQNVEKASRQICYVQVTNLRHSIVLKQ